MKPTWQGIPTRIKKDIVQNLDYKSRFRLRMCSKSDLELTESCPIHLEQIEFYVTPIPYLACHPHVLYINDRFGSSIEVRENIVDHLFNIFKLKNSTVKSVIFGFLNYPAPGKNDIVEMFIAKLKNLEDTVKIKAEAVYFNTDKLPEQDLFRLFQIFDEKCIKSISFRQTVSPELLAILMKTEAWRNLKEIHFYGIQETPMDTVFHCNKISMIVGELSAKNVWKFMNTFIKRNDLKEGYGFRINYLSDLTIEQILSESNMNQKGVPVPSESDHETSYQFPTKSQNLILAFRIRESLFGCKDLEGYICNVENSNEYRYQTPPNHLQMEKRLLEMKPIDDFLCSLKINE